MSDNFEKFMFIGGFADGQLLGVATGRDSCDIPEPIREMTLVSQSGAGDTKNKTYPLHRYEKQRITAGNTIYHVMVWVDIGKDCIGALIEGYRR
jgi:hypothetical protein